MHLLNLLLIYDCPQLCKKTNKKDSYNESSKWKASPCTSPLSCSFKADEQSVTPIKFSGSKSSRYGDTEA